MSPPVSVRSLSARSAAVAAVLAVFPAPAPAQAAPRIVAADTLEAAVVRKVNQIRRARGLRALKVTAPLQRAAADHAVNMARHGYFTHNWSNGAAFARWIRRYWPGRGEYRSWSVGENLYWRGPTITAAHVVSAWMTSPPHRRNLLARSWRNIGVGAVHMTVGVGAYAGVDTPTLVAAEFGYRR